MMNIFRPPSVFKNKGLFWAAVVTVTFVSWVFAYEYPLVSENDKLLYLISRIFVIALLLIACLGVTLRPGIIGWQNFYTISAYLYTCQGEYFRPDYLFSYLQFLIGQAILFKQSRRTFLTLHAIGSFLFILVMNIAYDRNSIRRLTSDHFFDYVTIVFVFFAVAYMIFTQFNKFREEKDRAQSRFLLLGKQSANIVHDIKSLATAPQIYLEMLLEKKKVIDPEVYQIISQLNDDLGRMAAKTQAIYQMIRFENPDNSSKNIKNIVNDSLSFLETRLSNVTIIFNGSSKIRLPNGGLDLILMNLIYNSLKAWSKNKIKSPHLEISLSNSTLSMTDNAGGMNEDLIRQFNSGHMENNTGLGLFLISDTAQSLDLRVHLSNENTAHGFGLKAEIDFSNHVK